MRYALLLAAGLSAPGLLAPGSARSQAPPARVQTPPAPAPAPPAAPAAPTPLDAYAEAAATTIIAEQSCPGLRLNAGALTTLRLAAKVVPAQEPALEEKLRARAGEIRRQLAADGPAAWCAAALAAFGPQGSVARGVLAPRP